MNKKSSFRRITQDIGFKLFIILIALVILTMILSSGILNGSPASAMFTQGFMTINNIRQLLYNLVIQICFLCGIGLIIISGNIDLSVAGQACMCSMIFACLCQDTSLPWGIVLVITLLAAVVMGLINTFLVTKLKFPSFIATIGMASVYSGLCKILTSGNNINIARDSFLNIAKVTVGNIFPAIFLFAIAMLILFQFVLIKTEFGRSVYFIGGNVSAARLAGINVNRTIMELFIINSVMACIGGLLWTCNLKLASPTAIILNGDDMTVISAAILGGIAFFGGKGNLIGPFIALLLLNVLDNTLTVIGVSTYWNVVAQGALLVIALIYDFVSNERRRKATLINKRN